MTDGLAARVPIWTITPMWLGSSGHTVESVYPTISL